MGQTKRLEAIDGLRGVAALAVVLFHYVGIIPLMGIPVGPAGEAVVSVTRYGYLGVPVFFVLSGYVIAMTASRYAFTPGTGARFVLRRLVRLAPPYWVMVVLFAVTLTGGRAAGFFANTTVTAGQVAAHLGYVQNLLGFPALDVVHWTLCLEVQFYFVFAAAAVAGRRFSPGVRLACLTALTAGSVLIDVADAVPLAWFPRLWYQFGAGVLAYHAGGDRLARLALLLFLPALVGTGLYRGQAADVTVAAVAGLLPFVSREGVYLPDRGGVLLGLGRISYSLYLVHGFVGLGMSVVFRSAVRSEAAAWLVITAGTLLAIAGAAVFYRLCERRSIEWSRLVRVGPGRPPAPVPAIEVVHHGPVATSVRWGPTAPPARPGTYRP